jgi:hypothetical protein
VTYWLASKSRDTQRENNIHDTRFEVLAAVDVTIMSLRDVIGTGRFDTTFCIYLQVLHNAGVCLPSHVVTSQNTAILT